MTIHELIASMGIADDAKEEAAAAVRSFLDGAYVPKARFNEVNEEKKALQSALSDRDKQLDALKKGAGDNDDLKQQIKDLQAANKKAAEEYEASMKDMRLMTAIKIAVASDAQDVDIVSGLFDKTKLIVGDDGKITGLDEQLTALKQNKPFLFKPQTTPIGGYKPAGGGNPTKNPFAKDSFNLTEQGKLFRENPEQARALAAAAGLTI